MTQVEHNFVPKNSYTLEELVDCGQGRLFGPGNAALPVDNMLMLDRIVEIDADGGVHGRGQIIAELDITPELWFFDCHFPGDPVMPGCLGLDALWQLLGFYLGWSGHPGRGPGTWSWRGKIYWRNTADFKEGSLRVIDKSTY